MAVIERLRADHADAVVEFERENRAYFAASVPDRGDAYFANFTQRHEGLLAEQADGLCHFHLVVENGEVLGRVNLVDVADGEAELGFRIAEKAAGRGLATKSVHEVCELARGYGLTRLRAAAATTNRGSRKVLEHNGFVEQGEAVVDGLPEVRYLRTL